MHSMTQEDRLVIGGVDAHAATHHAAALDQRGALLATQAFAVSTSGYRQLLKWLRGFGEVKVVAVESTGAYAAGLVRYLRGHGVWVLEVNRPHAHARRRRGKNDPIDAEMAARQAFAGEATTIPKRTDGIVESIRQLRVARESAVKARTAALVQLGELVITAPQELRDQLSDRKTLRGKASMCRRLRPTAGELGTPTQAAKFAALDQSADRAARPRSRDARPAAAVTRPHCCAANHPAARDLHPARRPAAGHRRREHRPDAQRARLRCSVRHQPDPRLVGQDKSPPPQLRRQPRANRTLHLIAVCRLRYCDRSRTYAARRTGEGKTKPEVIRCVKRYIARETYHTLLADLQALQTPQTPRTTTSIQCGGFGASINRHRT
jgi:transposase